jgi:hypothetical protein
MVLEDFQNYMMSRDPEIQTSLLVQRLWRTELSSNISTGVRELELDMQLGGEPSAV